MLSREQICSQQVHCLSCPLSVGVTGKQCDKLSQLEINEIMRGERIDDRKDSKDCSNGR